MNKEARQNHKYSRLVCSVESGLLSMPNLNRVLAEDKAPLAEMRGYRNVCAHSLSAMLYWEGPRLRLPSRAWVEDYTWLARRLFHLPDEQPTQPVDLYDAEVDAPGQLHRYLKSCCNVLDAAWRDMADSLAT
ncbi:MAG: hypothetical protein HYU66_21380 [Armatimonadetes bacterium]|nr:hypothetical protein [Armatimonadota bacterium]